MKAEEKIITFESYYDPMLAHIVRTRLEANGIPCFIADENTIGANPLYNQAVGGVKLKIFERDLERCNEILARDGDMHEQDHTEMDGDNDTYVACPFCGSVNVNNIAPENKSGDWSAVLGSFVNLINPLQQQNNWHCNTCQADFE